MAIVPARKVPAKKVTAARAAVPDKSKVERAALSIIRSPRPRKPASQEKTSGFQFLETFFVAWGQHPHAREVAVIHDSVQFHPLVAAQEPGKVSDDISRQHLARDQH